MAGGGFGEAALLSAVIGGGVSAVKGEDPLKGALLGGLMGGATGGIGNLLSPANAATTGVLGPGLENMLVDNVGNSVVENMMTTGAAGPAFENAFLGSTDRKSVV